MISWSTDPEQVRCVQKPEYLDIHCSKFRPINVHEEWRKHEMSHEIENENQGGILSNKILWLCIGAGIFLLI